jgi:hypothetical protein
MQRPTDCLLPQPHAGACGCAECKAVHSRLAQRSKRHHTTIHQDSNSQINAKRRNTSCALRVAREGDQGDEEDAPTRTPTRATGVPASTGPHMKVQREDVEDREEKHPSFHVVERGPSLKAGPHAGQFHGKVSIWSDFYLAHPAPIGYVHYVRGVLEGEAHLPWSGSGQPPSASKGTNQHGMVNRAYPCGRYLMCGVKKQGRWVGEVMVHRNTSRYKGAVKFQCTFNREGVRDKVVQVKAPVNANAAKRRLDRFVSRMNNNEAYDAANNQAQQPTLQVHHSMLAAMVSEHAACNPIDGDLETYKYSARLHQLIALQVAGDRPRAAWELSPAFQRVVLRLQRVTKWRKQRVALHALARIVPAVVDTIISTFMCQFLHVTPRMTRVIHSCKPTLAASSV